MKFSVTGKLDVLQIFCFCLTSVFYCRFVTISPSAAVPKLGAAAPWCAVRHCRGRRESCCICRCQVRSVPRNSVMEKYCLEELFVYRLLSDTSQCNIFCNNCPFNFINMSEVKIRRTFLSTFEKIIKKNSAFLRILFNYGKF